MPVFNEGAVIADAVGDVARHVLSGVEGGELIVVDDGSTDATSSVLADACARDGRMRVVSQANAGHGAALLAGVDAARGEYVLLLDSDRQVGLDDFAAHWRAVTEDKLDGLLGVRTPRRDPLHRRAVSWLMRLLIKALFGRAPRDAGVPYKIVKRAVFNQLRAGLGRCDTVPSVLLAIHLAERPELRSSEVAVVHTARASGRSTLNLPRLAATCWRAAVEIAAMRAASRASRARGR